MTTIDQAKLVEFSDKCYQHADNLHRGKTKSIAISSASLQFYGYSIQDMICMFKEILTCIEGPTHPDDTHFTEWRVSAYRRGDKYVISAVTKLQPKVAN